MGAFSGNLILAAVELIQSCDIGPFLVIDICLRLGILGADAREGFNLAGCEATFSDDGF